MTALDGGGDGTLAHAGARTPATTPATTPARPFDPFTLALFGGLVLWFLQTITGFRSPAAPIVVSDGDSGSAIRQLVFTGAGAAAFGWMLVSGSLARAVAGRGHLVALLVFAAASTLYSLQPVLTVKRFAILLFGSMLFLAITQSARHPVRLLLWTLVTTTGLAAWVSIGARFGLPASTWSIEERPGLAGVTGHPNQLGVILASGIVLSLGLRARGAAGAWLLVARAGMVIGLLLAQSMTSIALAAVGVGVYASLRLARGQRFVALALALPLAFAVVSFGVEETRDALLSSVGRDATLSGRTELWDVVTEEIRARPILGAGYGAFWHEGRGRELVGTWNPRQSHQAFLDVLLDVGVAGLLLVLLATFGTVLIVLLRYHARRLAMPPDVAATAAVVVALCSVYAMGESFLLKADKFPFLVVLWGVIVLTLPDSRLESTVQRGEGHPEEPRGLAR